MSNRKATRRPKTKQSEASIKERLRPRPNLAFVKEEQTEKLNRTNTRPEKFARLLEYENVAYRHIKES